MTDDEAPEVVHCETKEERRAQRRKLAEEGIAMGLSEEDAYMIVDMVQHAKMKAYDAIEAVADTAPPHLRSYIRFEALNHLGAATRASQEALEEGRTMALLRAILGRAMLDREAQQATKSH